MHVHQFILYWITWTQVKVTGLCQFFPFYVNYTFEMIYVANYSFYFTFTFTEMWLISLVYVKSDRSDAEGGRGRGHFVSQSTDNRVIITSDINEKTQNIKSDQQYSEIEQPSSADNKKGKRSKPSEKTHKKQDEKADWYIENELIYNKGTCICLI